MLQVNSASRSSTKELDEMYMMVLKNLITEDHDEDNEDFATLFKEIVGYIVILFDTFSVITLTGLLAVSSFEMNRVLDPLRSVLIIPDDRISLIQLFHLSFSDFLLDKQRCLDPQFWIDEKKAHNNLFAHCLKLMSERLRKDICNLQLPGAPATEAVTSSVEEHLPLNVQYACSYWTGHLQQGNVELCDNGQVHGFLKEHFLHWLEALSWIGKTSEAILMIYALEALIPVDKSPNLYAFVHDAKRFILYNRLVIEHTPLQLYRSAIVIAPEKSIVQRQFEERIPAWIQRKLKVQANWSTTLQTLEGHSNAVNSVAFSPDSKQVVSGSYDKTVRLWDTTIGVLQKTLKGHSSIVSSVTLLLGNKAEDGLFVSNDWIIEGKAKILWLPLDYRVTSKAVWNRIIVLGHSSGRISILGFNEGSKYI